MAGTGIDVSWASGHWITADYYHSRPCRSLVGFALLFGLEVASSRYAERLASQVRHFCSDSTEHDGMKVAQVFDLSISKSTLQRFLEACREGASMPKVLRRTFGPGEILDRVARIGEDGLRIRLGGGGDVLSVPERLADIRENYAGTQAQALGSLLE